MTMAYSSQGCVGSWFLPVSVVLKPQWQTHMNTKLSVHILIYSYLETKPRQPWRFSCRSSDPGPIGDWKYWFLRRNENRSSQRKALPTRRETTTNSHWGKTGTLTTALFLYPWDNHVRTANLRLYFLRYLFARTECGSAGVRAILKREFLLFSFFFSILDQFSCRSPSYFLVNVGIKSQSARVSGNSF